MLVDNAYQIAWKIGVRSTSLSTIRHLDYMKIALRSKDFEQFKT